jgi:hypothetical protein
MKNENVRMKNREVTMNHGACHRERGLQPESRDVVFPQCAPASGWPTLAAFARVGNAIATHQPIANAFALFVDALREIFDENAYARFLRRTQLPNSRAAYAAFLREHALCRERRARCC